MKLTIFTPTYNRATTIVRTYHSLRQQSCKDFEWLIVDDGSTDGTEDIVASWLRVDNGFSIRYIWQQNCGKYRAYNNGLRNAKGDMFFCVDSDDWLPSNSVELICCYYDELMSDCILAGIIALKEYSNHKLIGKSYLKGLNRSSLYNLELIGEGGERSLVLKTKIARLNPFPEETDERFMTESVIYDRLEGKYEFIVKNDILTTCEYQQDGLSSNPRELMLRNPAGYKLYYAQRLDLTSSLFERITLILRYHAFRRIHGGTVYSYNGKHKLLVTLLSPLGLVMEAYYKKR